jgi:hypothetical protein
MGSFSKEEQGLRTMEDYVRICISSRSAVSAGPTSRNSLELYRSCRWRQSNYIFEIRHISTGTVTMRARRAYNM